MFTEPQFVTMKNVHYRVKIPSSIRIQSTNFSQDLWSGRNISRYISSCGHCFLYHMVSSLLDSTPPFGSSNHYSASHSSTVRHVQFMLLKPFEDTIRSWVTKGPKTTNDCATKGQQQNYCSPHSSQQKIQTLPSLKGGKYVKSWRKNKNTVMGPG